MLGATLKCVYQSFPRRGGPQYEMPACATERSQELSGVSY